MKVLSIIGLLFVSSSVFAQLTAENPQQQTVAAAPQQQTVTPQEIQASFIQLFMDVAYLDSTNSTVQTVSAPMEGYKLLKYVGNGQWEAMDYTLHTGDKVLMYNGVAYYSYAANSYLTTTKKYNKVVKDAKKQAKREQGGGFNLGKAINTGLIVTNEVLNARDRVRYGVNSGSWSSSSPTRPRPQIYY